MSTITLRPFLAEDIDEIVELIQSAIEELAEDHYSVAQRGAWMESFDDEAALATRLGRQLTLLALMDGAPAGVISLAPGGRIDLLYTHPDHARKGVASQLCEAVERLGAARDLKFMEVDASDCALDLFVARGYEPIQRQTVERGGEWLANTRMRKTLDAPAKGH